MTFCSIFSKYGVSDAESHKCLSKDKVQKKSFPAIFANTTMAKQDSTLGIHVTGNF